MNRHYNKTEQENKKVIELYLSNSVVHNVEKHFLNINFIVCSCYNLSFCLHGKFSTCCNGFSQTILKNLGFSLIKYGLAGFMEIYTCSLFFDNDSST